MDDVRLTLDRLIRDRGDDYASISRLLNRNLAYVQQFIRRGTPRKLDEADRALLARYFGVDEALLGGGEGTGVKGAGGLKLVPRLSIGASAGPGAMPVDERAFGQIGFDPAWLRALGVSPAKLSMIQVEGDSMCPTLADGDEILVDGSDAADRLRPGIYVLRIDDVLLVKRLAPDGRRQLSIISDNPAFPDMGPYDPSRHAIIGRVVWAGRKL